MYMYEAPTKAVFTTVEGVSFLPWSNWLSLANDLNWLPFEFGCQFINLNRYLSIYFFLAEFQEAFNLFDNRGDGKIQLNQVKWRLIKIHNTIGFLHRCFLICVCCRHRCTGWRMPTRPWTKSHRVRCEEVHASIESRRTHFVRGVFAHLSCHLEGSFRWHGRRFHRGPTAFRQRRKRFHFNGWATASADYAGREIDRRRGWTIAGEPGRFARQC